MGYAVLFDFSRLLILLVSDIDLMIAALAGLLLGFTMEITFGILLGYLLFRRRSWPGMSLLSVITRLEIGSYHYDLFSQNLLDRAHAHGLKVMVYTVNTESYLTSWRSYFPDGIITDHVKQIANYQTAIKIR